MVMDTRTTDGMYKYASTAAYLTPAATKKRPTQPYYRHTVNPNFGCGGQYKQVVSERSGKFFPGQFRANPCILKGNEVQVIGGYARTKPVSGYHIDLLGDWWNHSLWDDPNLWNGSFNSGFGEWNQSYANLANTRCLAKLKEAEFDAGVALGEIRETIGLLRNPISALTDQVLKCIKQGQKFNRKRGFADALAGGWLTYRYGIVPLMSDVQALIQLCEKKLRRVEGMQRKAGGFKTTDSFQKKVDKTIIIGDPKFVLTTLFEFERTYTTTHHVYYLRTFESDELQMSRVLGVHPSQLPSVVWELTRLSFVFDWFVAVGDWLRAITPDPTILYLGQSVSQKIETRLAATVTRVSSPYGLDPETPPILPSVKAVLRKLERRVPTTTVVLPPFNPNFFQIKRLLDSIALVWALLPIRR